ncbi:MAG: hypothetical protein H7A27_04910 [Spirochaetaceae bacterium]|nr:hypothetical protein [Spirochaetaceae bacterium]
MARLSRAGPTGLGQLRLALSSLRSADDALRSRDRPGSALRAVSAYLVGFVIIRTATNAYLFISTLGRLSSPAEGRGLAALLVALACAPLAAAVCLSGDRSGAERRLALLPLSRPLRLAVAALSPTASAATIALLASVLPAVAAAPLAMRSAWPWLGVAAWASFTAAAAGLGLRSAASAIAAATRRSRPRSGGHGRRIALLATMLASAAANPSPRIASGRLVVTLFGSAELAAADLAGLADRLSAGAMAAIAAAAGSFALAAAIAEDAARLRGRRSPRARDAALERGRRRPAPAGSAAGWPSCWRWPRRRPAGGASARAWPRRPPSRRYASPRKRGRRSRSPPRRPTLPSRSGRRSPS